MSTDIDDGTAEYFADDLRGRDLPGGSAPMKFDTPLDPDSPSGQVDSSVLTEALLRDSGADRGPRIAGTDQSNPRRDASESTPWYRRIPRRILLAVLLAPSLGAATPFAWSYLRSYESTDDAQIDGHIDPISSRIDGTVVRVHVDDCDRVREGQLLVEIDPRDAHVAVDQARARLDQAVAQLASAKQDYAGALARVREAEAERFRAQRDARRYAALLPEAAVSQEEYDRYDAIARVDGAKLDSDRETAGSALKAIGAREADAAAAKAALDQALLNLSYTEIYAPADGIVGKRTVQVGSRVQPGQSLMFVTESDRIWVTANFKETQLARMHPGQKVTIRVDTFGRDYRGSVENLPGASGDRFSLLPPENATGNYVKVVQRLPVRIAFESGQDPDHLLHPGMSVEPTVWLR